MNCFYPQKVGYSGQTRPWASFSDSCRRGAKQYCNQKGQRRQHRRPSHHWQLFSGDSLPRLGFVGFRVFVKWAVKVVRDWKKDLCYEKWPSVNTVPNLVGTTIWKYQNYWKPHAAACLFADHRGVLVASASRRSHDEVAWKVSRVFTSPQILFDFCFRNHAFIIR